MELKNSSEQYGSITKLFHWVIALCVIAMLIIGVTMGNISDKVLRGDVYAFHKSLGLTILVLMLLRLLWRLANRTPTLPSHVKPWQKIAARTNHALLYIALICMPLSGLIMSVAAGYPPKYFGLFTVTLPIAKSKAVSGVFSDIHTILAWTILVLISVHILAALKHHFMDNDFVLKRMLPNFFKINRQQRKRENSYGLD